MLTIDEYIAKMKKADKMDELDYLKQSENMSAVIKYVMNYFNEYLTLETCDAEAIKMKHKRDKLEQELESKYPKSKDFILNFYLQQRIGIHKEVKNWLEGLPYYLFLYSEDDFASAAEEFCTGYKLTNESMVQYRSDIQALMKEIKMRNTEEPKPFTMLHIDTNLAEWIVDTYRQYGVNLFSFAHDHAFLYWERYVKYERGPWGEGAYYINHYNHRYNSNPFDLDRIYEDNSHRPFLHDKRGELEMLVMHEWLFKWAHDDEYWSEYVNLCVDRGRVKIVQHINALLPVSLPALKYPEDVQCETKYILWSDGNLKSLPNGAYILKIEETLKSPKIWQEAEAMISLTKRLDEVFKLCGAPKLLELDSPFKVQSFDEEQFLNCCSILEKKMKKHSGMKVAIVNGPSNQRSKPNGYIATIEDIIKLKVQLRERKIRLRFSIDFPLLLAGKKSYFNQSEIMSTLTEMKNSIICMHVANIGRQPSFRSTRKTNDDQDVEYLSKFKYPSYDDFYTMLRIIFNDTQKRYIVPRNIDNDAQLEDLVDNMLRSGFTFCGGGIQNE